MTDQWHQEFREMLCAKHNSAEEKGHQHVCPQEKEEAKVTEERSKQLAQAKY